MVELTGEKVKLFRAALLHFTPFLFIVFCSVFLQNLPSDHPLIKLLNEHLHFRMVLFWIIVGFQFLAYLVFFHRKWRGYQQLIKQEVSNTENVNVSWIRFFMGVFLIINLFFLVDLLVVIHSDYSFWPYKATGVVFSLSVFALGYKGILQREIFYPSDTIIGQQSATSILKPDEHLIRKLITYIEDKRPYLDPELSLSVLAKALEMNRGQLSQLINEGTGDNFYDFINKYRVEEVKRLMVDPRMKHFNLLGLALEAGFKSKSTFNLIFKRFTGLTPSEYRKNQIP